MKIDRRSFFGLFFAPYIERFRKLFGKRKEGLVSYKFYYKAVVLDGPTNPVSRYKYFNSDIEKAVESLWRGAAEKMDRNIRDVLK